MHYSQIAEVCLKSLIFLDPDIGPLQVHANSFIYWSQSPGHVWTMNMNFGGQSLYQTAAGDCHTLVTSKHAKLWADPAWSWWSVPMAPRNFLDSMLVILWENKVARSPHQSWWLLADPTASRRCHFRSTWKWCKSKESSKPLSVICNTQSEFIMDREV